MESQKVELIGIESELLVIRGWGGWEVDETLTQGPYFNEREDNQGSVIVVTIVHG